VVASCPWTHEQQTKLKSQHQQTPKNRHTGDASPTQRDTGCLGSVLTIRDRSLETAARPRKNAMAGARGYRTCATKMVPSGPRAPPNQPKSIGREKNTSTCACAASASKALVS
jgi:hypothetical protein